MDHVLKEPWTISRIYRQWKNTIIIIIAAAYYVLTYFYLAMIGGHLGPSAFGDFSVTMAVAGQGWVLALLGSNMAVYKILPPYFTESHYSYAKGYINCLFVSAILMSVLLSILLTLGYHLFHLSHQYSHPVIYASLLIPLMALTFLSSRILLSCNITLSTQVTAQLLFPIIILISLQVYLMHGTPLHAFTAVLTVGLSYAILAILLLLLLYFHIWRTLKPYRPQYLTKRWLRNSLNFFPLSLSWHGLYANTIILLGILGPSKLDVGLYAAAYRIANIVVIIQVNVLALFLPKISLAIKQNDPLNTKRLLRKLFKTTVTLAIILMLSVYESGQWLLQIYSPHFTQAYPILCIFVFGESLYLIFVIGSYLLQFYNLAKINIYCQISMLIFSLILSAILCTTYSMIGAVLSFIVPLMFMSFLQAWIVWRKVGILIWG